jgi:vacuolar protein sorting-associated protein 13A/C
VSDKSFFDLCVRTRGPLNADLIRVDLCDLNLAYRDGKAEKIVINTGEDFVWRILDIANRTMLATAELAGVDLDLMWNEEAGKFSVSIRDPIYDDLDSGTFTERFPSILPLVIHISGDLVLTLLTLINL